MEKIEPKLQINCAYPIESAALRSVTIGAVSAIKAARIPTKLKRIRSINMLGSENIILRIRCKPRKPIAIGLIRRLSRI